MQVAVIGIGNWGRNLLRNFINHRAVDRVFCYDVDRKRCASLKNEYPNIVPLAKYQEVLDNKLIEAVVIATPATKHFPLAKQALAHHKHVLVEKPLALTPHEAAILIKLAHAKHVKLMVDHITVYHNAIRKIKEIVDSGTLGKILYFDAVRTSQGLAKSDVNVAWDLAIHDLATLDFLFSQSPRSISACGRRYSNKHESIAHINLLFEKWIGHIHVNWWSPTKARRIAIGGTKKTIIFDDIGAKAKIMIYNTQIRQKQEPASSVRYLFKEPLSLVADEFIRAIKKNYEPLTNGAAGLRIVKILTAAEKSMKNSGTPIRLTSV